MTKEEMNVREKIIATTIELINLSNDTGKVTVRDIAKKVGVGIGLINYHFQSKDKLISICVQRMISDVINNFDPSYKNLDMRPIEKLRYLFKATSAFLVGNPEISRISILSDLISGSKIDNSSQTAKVYTTVLKEVCGDKKTKKELFTILHILISSIQVAFLRRDIIEELSGIDFYDKEQREDFVDSLLDKVLYDHL